MISVLIPTKNEEQDLPACLASVSWSDDIHVFDSFSSDGTVDVAKNLGAVVHQRKFDNYASQKNAALHGLKFRHDWVLLLDADERVPEALARELHEFCAKPLPSVVAARLRRRDFFMGRWLQHAQISPFYIRLVRPGQVHFEREVNEVLKVEGQIKNLHAPFDHFPFSKGLRHWIDKHNVYSTLEAKVAIELAASSARHSLRKALFGRDFNERRAHQKGLFYDVPFRPLVKFCYMVLVRRAFLDGRAGITYAVLQSVYEYFIVLKTRELARARATPSERKAPASHPPLGIPLDSAQAATLLDQDSHQPREPVAS